MEKNVLNTDLTGKVAVVTGAGGVLCSAFAKVLARAGAKVALLDLNEEAAQQFAGEITAEGGVANAIGSAISKVSGTCEQLVDYQVVPREKALERAKAEAVELAVAAGAVRELSLIHI